MVKIIPLVAGLASGEATTRLFFGVGLKDFFFAGWGGMGNAQSGGWGGPTSFSQAITLSELAGFVTSNVGTGAGGTTPAYGIHPQSGLGGLSGAVMANMRQNFIPAAIIYTGSIAIPKILTKLKAKRNANKLLKGIGLDSVVQA